MKFTITKIVFIEATIVCELALAGVTATLQVNLDIILLCYVQQVQGLLYYVLRSDEDRSRQCRRCGSWLLAIFIFKQRQWRQQQKR